VANETFRRPLPIQALKFIVDGTAELMMHPARFQILQYLREAGEPRFVDQIAKAKGIHPRMVSHHLDVLQEQGLIECKHELIKVNGSNREVAVRWSWPTDKAENVIQDILESVEMKKHER
jgi:DNA-binding transcriptional ArsR family regulator